jgi:hypothetical protein
MENPKDQITSKLKDANNVLVTVSANPSVDQLSAAIGLTLLLTKLKKHATAVFSGKVPSTIEFLKPEQTIEQTTDSLRDFIIALDKAKADKIRYKVEDTMVKIFITPYRTSIGEPDLVFSQGDFNVDIVIALGVHQKEDLDQAITSHGRILHDATIATVNTQTGTELGALNWTEPQASSLCEMIVTLVDKLAGDALDAQIATALLTGIVAETERFSNAKTSSITMNASAKLMAAGANQQLVATKLQEAKAVPPPPPPPAADSGTPPTQSSSPTDDTDDGALKITHDIPPPPPPPQIHIDEQGQMMGRSPLPSAVSPFEPTPVPAPDPHLYLDEATLPQPVQVRPTEPTSNLDTALFDNAFRAPNEAPVGGMLPTSFGQHTPGAPLNLPPANPPLMDHTNPPPPSEPIMPPPPEPQPLPLPLPPPPPPPIPVPPAPTPPPPAPELPKSVIDVMGTRTLKDIEKAVDSPHRKQREPMDYHAEATNQIAKAVAGRTLHDIEEKTQSPHLEYEAMHSEPQAKKEPNTEPESDEKTVPLPKDNPQESPMPPATPIGQVPADEPDESIVVPAPQIDEPQVAIKTDEQASEPADEMDESKIRERIDAALAAGDQTRLPARTDLNAAGELDVNHQEASVADDDAVKKVSIDKETGELRYPEIPPAQKNEAVNNTTAAPGSEPEAPPTVPPPLPFMPPAGGQDASNSTAAA